MLHCVPFQCSTSCDPGVATREVLCVETNEEGVDVVVPDILCQAEKPPSQQACNLDNTCARKLKHPTMGPSRLPRFPGSSFLSQEFASNERFTALYHDDPRSSCKLRQTSALKGFDLFTVQEATFISCGKCSENLSRIPLFNDQILDSTELGRTKGRRIHSVVFFSLGDGVSRGISLPKWRHVCGRPSGLQV